MLTRATRKASFESSAASVDVIAATQQRELWKTSNPPFPKASPMMTTLALALLLLGAASTQAEPCGYYALTS
jgi:hypothetical protein